MFDISDASKTFSNLVPARFWQSWTNPRRKGLVTAKHRPGSPGQALPRPTRLSPIRSPRKLFFRSQPLNFLKIEPWDPNKTFFWPPNPWEKSCLPDSCYPDWGYTNSRHGRETTSRKLLALRTAIGGTAAATVTGTGAERDVPGPEARERDHTTPCAGEVLRFMFQMSRTKRPM
jgi:hypothetical protein